MIKSMTGYGVSTVTTNKVEVTVEVKSLNSKFMDLSIRTGKNYADREMEIRNMVTDKLVRGKVSISVDMQHTGMGEMSTTYNKEVFRNYYNTLKNMANEVGDPTQDIFRLALQAPDVATNNSDKEEVDQIWVLVKEALAQALGKCDKFRMDEGEALKEKLASYVDAIRKGLQQVAELDPARVENIRKRITNNLEQFLDEEKIDRNRLEQELIFYIEKLDINEEKVRLAKHLDYFDEVMATNDANGKKLGFISQEIGREINTIGSKANDADIQKIVVGMKEELEKIKEQTLNVL